MNGETTALRDIRNEENMNIRKHKETDLYVLREAELEHFDFVKLV